ncbi:DUF2868 domain-containing protein [Desulfomicrobium salsuginis]
MKHGMRLGDFLDLEWFLEQDRLADPAATLRRDRRLGLEAQAASVPAEGFGMFWLLRRRADAGTTPASVLASGLNVLRLVLAVAGLAAGVSLVRGLLAYAGAEPVNVSVFLLLAVFPQAGLCLLAALLLAARAMGLGQFRIPARPLFSLLWRRQGRLGAQAGFLRTLFLGQGWPARMLAWECLGLLHLGGLSLAIGSLAALLVGVTVTDLAFGWQSTLQVGAQGMHALVSLFALPWSWLPAQWGLTPTMGQIEGSRIVLKEGISTLASADLVAWWPFLAMCLLTYALLPRLVLLGFTRRALRRLERGFAHPALGRIADRMRSPLVATPDSAEAVSKALPLRTATPGDGVAPDGQAGADGAGCVFLLPPELEGRVAGEDLVATALRVGGEAPVRIVSAALESGDVRRVLAECAGLEWTGGRERYVVLVEAWQPPIRENLQALEILGRDEGGGRSLTLVLCGRPAKGRWLTAASAVDREVWSAAVERLAPLRIDIFGAER